MQLDPQTENKIENLYNHEIKVKRIKKEICQLIKFELSNTHIIKVNFTPLGIKILVQYTKKNKIIHFQIRVDLDYPFNRPQIHYLEKNQMVGQARDLIQLTLKQNQVWGPSMMLNVFVQRIGELYQKIEKNNQDQVLGKYYQNDIYQRTQLQEKGLKLFTMKQNTWKFLMKRSSEKIIGISYNAFLKFTTEGDNLKLQFWILVKDIVEVISNIEMKTLNIKYNNNQKGILQTLYFTHVEHLQQILQYLNPVQMIQRRVKLCQQNNEIKNQNLVKDYAYLIQYYSLRNQTLSNEYLQKMQNAIKKQYNPLQQKK